MKNKMDLVHSRKGECRESTERADTLALRLRKWLWRVLGRCAKREAQRQVAGYEAALAARDREHAEYRRTVDRDMDALRGELAIRDQEIKLLLGVVARDRERVEAERAHFTRLRQEAVELPNMEG